MKKTISLLLVICLIAAAFTACDNSQSSSKNKGSKSKNTEESSKVNDEDIDSSKIDPFKGLTYEISGISPYCKIAINNQGCSNEAQQYVTYTLDKEFYANGEKAIINAALNYNGQEEYTLYKEATTFEVSGQPEYITSVDGLDLTELKKELNDNLNAQKALAAGGEKLFSLEYYYVGGTHYESCDNITLSEVYFSSLKPIKNSIYNSRNTPYNRLSFVYAVTYTWHGEYVFDENETGKGTMWVNVSANNIIKYPDGSIKWGSTSSDDYDFVYSISQKGLEDCITTTIMCNSADYNISKVTV